MNPEATVPPSSFVRSPLDQAPYGVTRPEKPLVRQEDEATRSRRSARRTAVPVRGPATPPSFVRSPLDQAPYGVTRPPKPLVRQEAAATRPHRSARRTAVRVVGLVALMAVVAVGAAAVPSMKYRDATATADGLTADLAAMTALYEGAIAATAKQMAEVASLEDELAQSQAEVAALEDAKIRTVVKEKTVIEEVPKWVPSATEVAVEVTGFEGMIGIHDVQITQAYGFTDLIGIAVNKSGQTITYAELGCTFVDAEGRLLANGIVNKQSWAPGQSWGFTCSAQVDATGGIVRVNEMS